MLESARAVPDNATSTARDSSDLGACMMFPLISFWYARCPAGSFESGRRIMFMKMGKLKGYFGIDEELQLATIEVNKV